MEYWYDSVYASVDRVVIVEGATRYVPKNLKTKKGLSVDGTTELIKRLIKEKDPENKVTYIPYGNCTDKRQLQNQFLKVLEDKTWVVFNGGDELWRKEDLELLKTYAENDGRLRYFFVGTCWFHGDMHHRIITRPDWFKERSKRGKKCYDKKGKYVLQGHFDERVYMYRTGFRYRGDSFNICDKAGKRLYIHDTYKPHRLKVDVEFYHYGVIKPIDELRRKMDYYCQRSPSNKKFKGRNHKIFRALIDDYPTFKKKFRKNELIPFDGKHPEAILTHPWFGKTVWEISKEKDVKWLKGN